MSYQTPITISKALERIHRHEYVIPAIQREFVWEPEQICRLFDSLLRGYPIGTFLFWKIQAHQSRDYSFYDVVRDYHEVRHRHNVPLTIPVDEDVVAILDGQQRLTALNLGLRGSYTTKAKSARASSERYTTRLLHLDLLHSPDSAEDLENHFSFRFMTDAEAIKDSAGKTRFWFPVRDVMEIKRLPDAFDIVRHAGHADSCAFQSLSALWSTVMQTQTISFYELEDKTLDDVLDIFIRVNSAGTVLAKSDLLLSVATAQFTRRDARQALHELVDDLNDIGNGFRFTKDIVLKAGLILTDQPDVRVTALSFNKNTTEQLDRQWDSIDKSLRVAANLLASFGLSASNLTASTTLLPLADYIHHRQLGPEYVSAVRFRQDRYLARSWVLRTLLKQNVWGAGLNTLLVRLRRVVRLHGASGFPLAAIEAAMAELGKSLTFSEIEIDELAESTYKKPRALLLLTLLYPGINTERDFHVDHIFPRSRFTDIKLRELNVPGDDHDLYQDAVNRLANLQLLEGPVNISKQARWPHEWAAERYPDSESRGGYLASHDLAGLPESFDQFMPFYLRRRQIIVRRLTEQLSGSLPDAPTSDRPAKVLSSWAPPAASATASSARPPSPPDVPRALVGRKRRATIGRTLQGVPAGPVEYRFRGTIFQATIDGNQIVLSSGERFDSPTGAAMAVNGRQSVNGWQAWTRSGKTIADLHQ